MGVGLFRFGLVASAGFRARVGFGVGLVYGWDSGGFESRVASGYACGRVRVGFEVDLRLVCGEGWFRVGFCEGGCWVGLERVVVCSKSAVGLPCFRVGLWGGALAAPKNEKHMLLERGDGAGEDWAGTFHIISYIESKALSAQLAELNIQASWRREMC